MLGLWGECFPSLLGEFFGKCQRIILIRRFLCRGLVVKKTSICLSSTHRNKNHCRSLSRREGKRERKQNEKICLVTYFKENSWCIQPFESFCLVISQFVPASLQIPALTGSAANLDLTSMSLCPNKTYLCRYLPMLLWKKKKKNSYLFKKKKTFTWVWRCMAANAEKRLI